ncbi:hypothetical protein CEUSTIGMA_g4456.t1 [Chlamydomonas eustigma]|uniref:Uncharacterized protein n=1 Tax=Chlamydomonas eustigma TaxID=1157962 RepID=A0A250X247_9CHLO|nr:hypothetical protein CEUSTIGMA_g4456.t1 [Chlamydomonas eustigma]|eukprot:GAX77009.1 hypothetical protein CEUSTIGMA_g4456.t1 [Chlamydomonas eustigma]
MRVTRNVSYPTKSLKRTWYLPLIPLGCIVFMCTGIGLCSLWVLRVHYTEVAYNNMKATVNILDIRSTQIPLLDHLTSTI